ncbi:MAG: hypothetical protein R2876_02050 [Eubacteriales bacterium]
MRQWTHKEDEYLKKYYRLLDTKEIGRQLGRSVNSVRIHAKKLGLAESYPSTLCWECDRAAGQNMCVWARKFKEVEGWNAIATNILHKEEDGSSTLIKSYFVVGCPQFVQGRRGPES